MTPNDTSKTSRHPGEPLFMRLYDTMTLMTLIYIIYIIKEGEEHVHKRVPLYRKVRHTRHPVTKSIFANEINGLRNDTSQKHV